MDNAADMVAFHPMSIGDVEPKTLRLVKAHIDNIPDLPLHVHELLKIVYNIDRDSKDLTKLISTDPILVSRILQRVNTSFYAPQKKIDNLNLAITILGFWEIRNIALQYNFSQVFGKHGKRVLYDFKRLWEHLYLVSICEEALSQKLMSDKIEEVIVLGLLHDIGKFVFNTIDIPLLNKLDYQNNNESIFSLQHEERCFGINHSIVGSLLARKWSLAERTCVVLEHHHTPSFYSRKYIPREFQEEIILTCISDFFVNLFEDRPIVPVILPEYMVNFRYSYLTDDKYQDELLEKLNKAKSFLNCIID